MVVSKIFQEVNDFVGKSGCLGYLLLTGDVNAFWCLSRQNTGTSGDDMSQLGKRE